MANPDHADTSYFVAAVALEQYRSRLLHALRFIEEAASARLSVPPSEVETNLNAVVEYVFAGEQEFVQAQQKLQEHEEAYKDFESLRTATASARAAVAARLTALESEARQLEGDIGDIKRLLAQFESDPPISYSPYDAIGELARSARVSGPAAIPAGWRVGMPPGPPAQAQPAAAEQGQAEGQVTATAAASSGVGMDVDTAGPAGAAVAGASGGAADVAQAGAAAGILPLPMQPAVPPAASQAAAGASGASQQPASASQPASSSSAPPRPAPAPGGAAGLLSMLSSLPPQARGKLMGLLPKGWKPGDPLPQALLALDPRQLLAELSGGAGGTGAGRPSGSS